MKLSILIIASFLSLIIAGPVFAMEMICKSSTVVSSIIDLSSAEPAEQSGFVKGCPDKISFLLKRKSQTTKSDIYMVASLTNVAPSEKESCEYAAGYPERFLIMCARL